MRFASNRSFCKTSKCLSSEEFKKSVQEIQQFKVQLDSAIKLKLYGLYKQAVYGDVSENRPESNDHIERAKFDAWKKFRGLTKEEAEKKYITLAATLTKKEINNEKKNEIIRQIPGLEVELKGKILWIRFNRPKKRNAITWEMFKGITEVMNHFSVNGTNTVTVLTGKGSYYSSGNDLSNFSAVQTRGDIAEMVSKAGCVLSNYVEAFIKHKKVLVSLVNGPAIGIAVTVLPLSDLVIASDNATFRTPFTSLGQSPEGCSSYTFPKLMGHIKAAEVLLFERELSSTEAFERNLVNTILPAGSFEEKSSLMVERISTMPPESLLCNKALLRNAYEQELLECNRRETSTIKQRWQSNECAQAINKFLSRK